MVYHCSVSNRKVINSAFTTFFRMVWPSGEGLGLPGHGPQVSSSPMEPSFFIVVVMLDINLLSGVPIGVAWSGRGHPKKFVGHPTK